MRANDTIHAHDRGTIHPHATQHVRGRLRQRVGVRAPFDRSELRPLAIGHHARLGTVGHALGRIGDILRILGGLIRLADLRRETGSVLFADSAVCLTESKSSEATSALIVPPEIDSPRPAVKDTPPPVEPEDEEEDELV